ncbi:RdgB/HAM1 family non-canonical purine NTP pyrophosphatase [Ethanoligenens harbinense]|uniref:dITP/XTP pyrophosphatase n=1 Tax=Ethanoligenens harbinense (strain DSM 18485 / JCM 12961 / CGMCC 1.5033 / YUAN-3) TaxID=663278 RepID=E6U7X6_ETHHY|nr:RdgB/HAM1 family non-canonical purine NTP pyrophosphatase [Ethanoligenens harbinense]ADU25908.1 non-canonical purine NTP pyrophosphatase, rdgB/HAM1 family [Ethanoligenens harbinense YUAN-3]AVQ95064.1 non-canonical purine NTP pyrophosphatase, RdgB/HAM1 family [Ethanoligenens harbinense YUAN-3]AYF37755.1 non-canonical purine NTP pyrophosphatase, RdgB/HAM1 family [Ethanoligenens harbinense]AYF40476.1 non-canonical purine NTP pyrophosphatase, RdgB/HAM1 family [Ethanoligenens harbinense]QCN91310
MTFVAATGNAHKLTEIRRILAPLGHDVISQREAGVACDPEETGATFAENARIKAEAVCKAAGRPAVADDSGLCVDALDGAPGVYSARYAGAHATDDDRIAKLLAALSGVPEEKRTARFVSAICCLFPDGREIAVEGVCEGRVAFAKDGTDGFGYDPVFIEAESGKTFAALSGEEKDACSHRGRALRALAEALAPQD